MGNERGKWILIIDDEVEFSEALKMRIERCGFRVMTCEDSHKASQILINQRFACVIIDQRLKRASGATLLINVKRNAYHLNYATPFIFMSGDPDSEVLKKIARSIDGAFVKPFSVEELVERIHSLTVAKAVG